MSTLLVSAIVVLACMFLLFAVAQARKDNSLVDIFWGTGFAIIALVTLFHTGNFSARPLLVTGLTVIWGMRLSIYLAGRNLGKGEDYRYVEMRQRWGKHQALGAFFTVFLLQGTLMWLISLPVQLVNLHSGVPLNLLDGLGLALWATGFFFEAVGDAQLKRFKADPANKGRIMTSGLWKYTRHPNYFGEIAMWWGIFVLALSTPYWYVALLSPLLMTWLLMNVSGVPMLEKKYRENAEYREYVRKTPALFPKLF